MKNSLMLQVDGPQKHWEKLPKMNLKAKLSF